MLNVHPSLKLQCAVCIFAHQHVLYEQIEVISLRYRRTSYRSSIPVINQYSGKVLFWETFFFLKKQVRLLGKRFLTCGNKFVISPLTSLSKEKENTLLMSASFKVPVTEVWAQCEPFWVDRLRLCSVQWVIKQSQNPGQSLRTKALTGESVRRSRLPPFEHLSTVKTPPQASGQLFNSKLKLCFFILFFGWCKFILIARTLP